MSQDRIFYLASALARRFEGFYASPYLCPAGVPTIGYGSTHYRNGTAVTLRDPSVTIAQAEQMLFEELRATLPGVIKLCPGVDNPERAAALLDFTFNLGLGRLRASTLRKLVNAGQWTDVPTELKKWSRAGGRVLPGLVARRTAEAALIA